MNAEEIRALRKELRCSMQELAATLGIEPRIVMAWEDEAMFPTKRNIERMAELRRKGPSAVTRKRRRPSVPASPMAALADPELWLLVRKLVAYPDLRSQVGDLASSYADPAEASDDAP